MDDLTRNIIRKHISELHALRSGPANVSYQQPLIAEIQFLIAEEQAKSADKLEQQTVRLIQETAALTKFTRYLLWFTIAIAGFAVIQILIMLFEYFTTKH